MDFFLAYLQIMHTLLCILGLFACVVILYHIPWLVVLMLVIGLSVWLWKMKTAQIESFTGKDNIHYDSVHPPKADTTTACPPPRSAASCCGESAPLRLVNVPVCYP